MKKDGWSRLGSSYLKKNRRAFAISALFVGIFAVVGVLYHMPSEAIAYGASLCLVIGILLAAVDFGFYVRKYRMLEQLVDHVEVSLDGMPQAEDLSEETYQEMLQLLHQEKDRLLSASEHRYLEQNEYYTMWVHQIKTPIAAMRLLLQTDESQNKAALSMELFKIEQYVEMVLGYLRSDSISGDLMIRQYSLDVILRPAIRKYARMFILKKIALEYDEICCEVLTDQKWLTFVMEQLLSNALKYTGEGGRISLYMAAENRQTLVIEDTGIGIRREDIPRIFERGFTGYNGREHQKASGIGLYLSRKILKRLSHEIWIESETGKGTKVYIDLSNVSIDTRE